MPELVHVRDHVTLKEPTADDLALIESWASKGHALASIARALKIDPETFRRWRKDHPAVADALEAGKAQEHDLLVAKLLEMALSGNVVAILFALKARHSYVEGAPQDGAARSLVNITLPGALSLEQFKQSVVIDHGTADPRPE